MSQREVSRQRRARTLGERDSAAGIRERLGKRCAATRAARRPDICRARAMTLPQERRRPDWSLLPPPHAALRISVIVPGSQRSAAPAGCVAAPSPRSGARRHALRSRAVRGHRPRQQLHRRERAGRAPVRGAASRPGAARRRGAIPGRGRPCRPCPLVPDGRGVPAAAPNGRRRRRHRQHRRRHPRRGRLARGDAARDRGRRRRGRRPHRQRRRRRAAAPPRRRRAAATRSTSGCARASSTSSIPIRADPWPRHHQHFGASLAITVAAYRHVGGMPAEPFLEDEALYRRLRQHDLNVRHSDRVSVVTSSRRRGRVAVGLSWQLREWQACLAGRARAGGRRPARLGRGDRLAASAARRLAGARRRRRVDRRAASDACSMRSPTGSAEAASRWRASGGEASAFGAFWHGVEPRLLDHPKRRAPARADEGRRRGPALAHRAGDGGRRLLEQVEPVALVPRPRDVADATRRPRGCAPARSRAPRRRRADSRRPRASSARAARRRRARAPTRSARRSSPGRRVTSSTRPRRS